MRPEATAGSAEACVLLGWALFPTPLGRCGIAWSERGIVGLALPGRSDTDTAERLAVRLPGAAAAEPPPAVRRAIGEIQSLLAGRPADLAGIPLVLDGVPPFHRRVYAEVRRISAGTTATYGELAARLGAPGAARAVGQAMARNPFPIVVPCHRVLGGSGGIGGFSAEGGAETKRRMLALEGVTRPSGQVRLPFDPRRAVRHLRAADPALGLAMAALGPFRMELHRTPSTFAALARSICHQQLSPKAADTIHRRFLALYGDREPTPQETLRLSGEALRAAGLSGAKAAAIGDLAAHSLAGQVPTLEEARGLPDEEVVDRLSAVRGVGRWTAEMFLMFRLGRPDILPLGDYGLRRGYAVAFADAGAAASPAEIARRGERWRPYRTVASWYLWRAAEAGPGLAPPPARDTGGTG